MENAEIIQLLTEIRDLQKASQEHQRDALRLQATAIERQRQSIGLQRWGFRIIGAVVLGFATLMALSVWPIPRP